MSDREEQARLQVVRGGPTPAELAALVAVLAARAGAPAAADLPARSGWADPARRLRARTTAGPGAWRRSATPK